MPYKWIQDKTPAADRPEGGAAIFELEASTIRLKPGADDNFYLETMQDSKSVRLNSRNYLRTTDSATAVQIKPQVSVTGASTLSGLEVSPRFAAGCAGVNLVAINAGPLLKKGSGDLSGGVCAVQANLDFGISGDRVIGGDVSAFEAFLAIPSTYTYSAKVSFLRVRDVNIRGWDCFLNLDSAGTGMTTTDDKTGGTDYGTLKVYIGDTLYHIALYANS